MIFIRLNMELKKQISIIVDPPFLFLFFFSSDAMENFFEKPREHFIRKITSIGVYIQYSLICNRFFQWFQFWFHPIVTVCYRPKHKADACLIHKHISLLLWYNSALAFFFIPLSPGTNYIGVMKWREKHFWTQRCMVQKDLPVI